MLQVTYMGTEDSVMFRDVVFPRGEPVDLSHNVSLFEKLARLEYFEAKDLVDIPEVVEDPAVILGRIISRKTETARKPRVKRIEDK
jgi:hypothetical protein